MDIVIPQVNFAPIMTETILSVVAMALLLINVFVKSEQKAYLGYVALLGIGASIFSMCGAWNAAVPAFGGMVVQDNFSIFFSIICLLAAALTILIADPYMSR